MLTAAVSDRFRHRFLFAMFNICISISGFAILMCVHHNTHVMYGALFMITSGTYSAMPVVVCWFSMNLGGHHRRAVGTAWQIGFGNVRSEPELCEISTDLSADWRHHCQLQFPGD